MRESAKLVFDLLVPGGIKKRNGWVFELERLGFNESEINEIIEETEEQNKQKHDDTFFKIRFAEWKKDDESKRFMVEIYEDKVNELKRDYREIFDNNYKLSKAGVDYATRQFIMLLRDTAKIEKQIKSFAMRARVLASGKQDAISPDMILRAREYPVSSIYDAKKNYILCPYHDDHTPSMFIKNNFGYCFTCGAYADSIELMMNKYGFGFVDAVGKMQ